MDNIDQVAQTLFELDEHNELQQTYDKYGLKLSWTTAPTPIKDKYKSRALKTIAEPDISA